MISILDTIGNTPLIELKHILVESRVRFFAKLEAFNPGGSVKDRPAYEILAEALKSGLIDANTAVIESSSGNMGIGLAQVCRYFNLRFICVIDPKITGQNRKLLEAYGAELSIVEEPDPATGEYLSGRLSRVKELLAETKNAFWPNQYANRSASRAHHRTMSEIMRDMEGHLDYFFCSTSTCGTLRGCAEYLKIHSPRTTVVAVDAIGSVIFGSPSRKRLIPGHGASMVPDLFDTALADRSIHISDFECVVGCRKLIKKEALLVGGSSGAVLMAVERMCKDLSDGARCAGIFPDRGERYIDTIFSDRWVAEHFSSSESKWVREHYAIG
jgi:2,3-diaminopropionate biosynthesis protein SbnA